METNKERQFGILNDATLRHLLDLPDGEDRFANFLQNEMATKLEWVGDIIVAHPNADRLCQILLHNAQYGARFYSCELIDKIQKLPSAVKILELALDKEFGRDFYDHLFSALLDVYQKNGMLKPKRLKGLWDAYLYDPKTTDKSDCLRYHFAHLREFSVRKMSWTWRRIFDAHKDVSIVLSNYLIAKQGEVEYEMESFIFTHPQSGKLYKTLVSYGCAIPEHLLNDVTWHRDGVEILEMFFKKNTPSEQMSMEKFDAYLKALLHAYQRKGLLTEKLPYLWQAFAEDRWTDDVSDPVRYRISHLGSWEEYPHTWEFLFEIGNVNAIWNEYRKWYGVGKDMRSCIFRHPKADELVTRFITDGYKVTSYEEDFIDEYLNKKKLSKLLNDKEFRKKTDELLRKEKNILPKKK